MQSRMVLFTKEYFPISVLCLLFLIFRSWSILLRYLGRCNLSPIAFHARSPEYALKRAHIRDIFLRCDNASQFDSHKWYANLAAFFAPCSTRVFVLPCMDPSTQPHIQELDALVSCRLSFWYRYSPFWVYALWNVVPSRTFSPCSWHDQPS